MRNSFLIFFSCLLISCGKSSTAPVTQSYLSYYANGTFASYNGPFGYTNSYGVLSGYQIYSDGTASFSLSSGDSKSVQLYIRTNNPPPTNIILKVSDSLSFYPATDSTNNNSYKFDTTSYIIFSAFNSTMISGTFACHGTNNSGQSISITQGKFTVFR